MAECTLISPLLDGMTVVSELSQRSGASCFTLKHEGLDKLFVVKKLSIPESEDKTEALILTGAFPDAQAAHEYYGQIVEDLKQELSIREKLSDSPNFSAVLGYQVEPKESGIGYDVYILSEFSKTMQEMMNDRGMTGLDAVNLGIDICSALCVLRSRNLVFENLKPENIFVDSQDRFMLGDLGLASTDFMQYSSLPEQYKSSYTAPEFADMMANLNLTMDTYSLGMLLYRIYNGYHGPFEDEKTSPAGAEQRRMDGEALPTPLYADYELSEIILKACAPKQEDRYQTPEEFGQALKLYMQRNSISDELIVPPIVTGPEPEITAEELEEEIEPVSFTDVSELSSEFVDSFRPDTDRAPKDEPAPAEEEPEPSEEDLRGAEVDALIASAESMLGDAPEQAEDLSAEDTEDLFDAIMSGTAEPAEAEEAPAEDEAPAEAPAEAEELPETEELPVAEEPAAPEAEAPAEEAAEDEAEEESESSEGAEEAPEEAENEEADSEILTLPDKLEPRKTPEATEDRLEIVESDEEPKMPVKRSSSKHEKKHKKHKHKSKKKRILGIVLTVLIVLAVLAAAYFFLFRWYFVEVKSVDLVSKGYDFITLQIDSTGKPTDLNVTCSDTQNSYSPELSGNVVTFRGLSSNTEYTVEITSADNHKLTHSSITRATFTTYESTSIQALDLHLGEKEGSVEVRVAFEEGRTPDKYLVGYQCEGEAEKTRELSADEECLLITDLTLDREYTFRLLDHDEYFMVGNTENTITILPVVLAENLRALDYEIKGANVSLTVGWDCSSEISEPWNIHITDGESFNQDFTSDKTTCTVEGISLDSAYDITVSTAGMYNDLTCSLSAQPFIIRNLSATQDGSDLSVTWDNPGGDPASGWKVECVVLGADNNPMLLSADGNEATLKNVVPNATYQVTLKTDETNTLVGNTVVEVTTGDVQNFTEFNVKPSNIAMNLYTCPDFTDWDYNDVGPNEQKTTFAAREMIAFCMQCMAGNREDSEQTVVIHYVVRNEAGEPVVIYCSEPNSSTTWDGMWANHDRYCGEVEAPVKAGSYRLEIYVDSMLIASSAFKVA